LCIFQNTISHIIIFVKFKFLLGIKIIKKILYQIQSYIIKLFYKIISLRNKLKCHHIRLLCFYAALTWHNCHFLHYTRCPSLINQVNFLRIYWWQKIFSDKNGTVSKETKLFWSHCFLSRWRFFLQKDIKIFFKQNCSFSMIAIHLKTNTMIIDIQDHDMKKLKNKNLSIFDRGALIHILIRFLIFPEMTFQSLIVFDWMLRHAIIILLFISTDVVNSTWIQLEKISLFT